MGEGGGEGRATNGPHALSTDPKNLAAMGFLTLGRRFLNAQPDIIDDRLDVITRGTMALTVACARCHDHKFDPIPTADYYSLYGVFASSTEPKGDALPLLDDGTKTADPLPPSPQAAIDSISQPAPSAVGEGRGEGRTTNCLPYPSLPPDFPTTPPVIRGKTP